MAKKAAQKLQLAQDEEDANLQLACEKGVLEEVRRALEEDLDGDGIGADTNSRTRDPEPLTPLMIAAKGGFPAVVELLLGHAASVDARSGPGAMNEKEQRAAKRAGLSYKKQTALMLAAEAGHAECVEVLLRHAASAHLRDSEGRTALMMVAEPRGASAAANALRQFAKEGLLRDAAAEGHFELVNALMLHEGWGLEVESADTDVMGTHELLRLRGSLPAPAIELLLEATGQGPANVLACNGWGENALHLACQGGRMEAVTLLLDRMRASHGLDVARGVEAKTRCLETPLMFAAMKGHAGVIEALCRSDEELLTFYGAAVEDQNEFGFTALMLAAKYGHVAACRSLLRHGAKIESTSRDGYTPLILAAESGHLSACKLLKDVKADVDAKMEWGRTAMDYANELGHKDIVDLLTPEDKDDLTAGGAGKKGARKR